MRFGGAGRRDDVPLCGESWGQETGTSGRHPNLVAKVVVSGSVGVHSSEAGSGHLIPIWDTSIAGLLCSHYSVKTNCNGPFDHHSIMKT